MFSAVVQDRDRAGPHPGLLTREFLRLLLFERGEVLLHGGLLEGPGQRRIVRCRLPQPVEIRPRFLQRPEDLPGEPGVGYRFDPKLRCPSNSVSEQWYSMPFGIENDAYKAAGNKKDALTSYNKAVELNSKSSSAKKIKEFSTNK